MNTVLINGISAKSGGGKEIFDNFLREISNDSSGTLYFIVVTPNPADYRMYHSVPNMRIVNQSRILSSKLFLGFYYLVYLPWIVRKMNARIILNFADVIVPIRAVKQIYYFDWAYAVYPESVVWQRMNFRQLMNRRLKALLIRLFINHADLVIAQTNVISSRLRKELGCQHVAVIQTPISSGRNRPMGIKPVVTNGSKKRLICLSNAAPHKNVEFLIPVARAIKALQLDFIILTTIDLNERSLFSTQYTEYVAEELTGYLENVGPIDSSDVYTLLSECDGLIFPTLLESYGLPYYEAMSVGIPVLTSNLDFAHEACGSAAYYFDPFCVDSLIRVLSSDFSLEKSKKKLIEGRAIVANLPDWSTSYMEIKKCIGSLLLNGVR